MAETKRIIVAVTGASGAIFADCLVSGLAGAGVEVHLIVSDAGALVVGHELGRSPEELWRDKVTAVYDPADFTAPAASGSAGFVGMAVVPCTVGTLGAIARGISANLIHRAADVMLKERKKLLLAVRETPFNRVHMENMLAVNDAGAIICPPLLAFYHRPVDLRDAADHFAGRVASLMEIDVAGMPQWGFKPENP